MVSSLPAIDRIAATQCGGIVTVTFGTTQPIHLFLLWTDRDPICLDRTVEFRGEERVCGKDCTFQAIDCLEQAEAGDTLTHHFTFQADTLNPLVWVWFSTGCAWVLNSWQSVPALLDIQDCQTGSFSTFSQRLTNHNGNICSLPLPTVPNLRLDDVVYDPDGQSNGFPWVQFTIGATGTYYLSVDVRIQMRFTASTQFVYIVEAGVQIFEPPNAHLMANGEIRRITQSVVVNLTAGAQIGASACTVVGAGLGRVLAMTPTEGFWISKQS